MGSRRLLDRRAGMNGSFEYCRRLWQAEGCYGLWQINQVGGLRRCRVCSPQRLMFVLYGVLHGIVPWGGGSSMCIGRSGLSFTMCSRSAIVALFCCGRSVWLSGTVAAHLLVISLL